MLQNSSVLWFSVVENCIVPHFSFGFVITDYIMNSDSVPAKSVCTVKDTGENIAALEQADMETMFVPPTPPPSLLIS